MKKPAKSQYVPFLKGKRVSLRPVEVEDAIVFYQAVNDQEARQHLGHHQPLTLEQEREWIRAQKTTNQKVVLTIVLNKTDECIGNISLFHIDLVHRSAETGLLIAAPKYRNRGYGPEAKELMLSYAFCELGLHRIEARTFATNPASQRSLEKSGYTREGTLREARLVNGKQTDVYVYSILRKEWEERKSTQP
ncbi:MAG: GNAT family protein [Patescibacteria group bacterium]